nr:putative disease resistance protein [Quercus suber]
MAEAIVSFVTGKLSDLLIEEVVSLYEVHGQVDSIDRELTRIQCFLKDADVKQKGDERVKNWVRDIRDVAYDVEDVIDIFILKLRSRPKKPGFIGFIKRSRFFFSDLEARRELAKEMQSIKIRIQEISTSRVRYGIENIGGERGSYACDRLLERRRSSPHIDDHDIIGFDEDIKRQSNSHLRSMLCFSRYEEFHRRDQWTSLLRSHKLLRVIDLEGVTAHVLPKEMRELIHLRYLGLKNTKLQRIPFSIDNLRNLQTLDIRGTKISRVPNEIWKMQSIRHLYLQQTAITGNPPAYVSSMNLATLSTVSIYGNIWIPNFLGKLTSLRKLGIHGCFGSQAEALSKSLLKLINLENFSLIGNDPILEPTLRLILSQNIHKLYLSGSIEKLLEPQHIQPNLSKLSLKMSQLVHDPFTTLERLPNLRMLKLLSNSFSGRKMVCSSDGFPRLHILEIHDLDNLEEWRVEEGALPSLRRLIISGCRELKMLPEGLQYVTSLKELVVEDMPETFEDRIEQDNGDDWYKIQHIPSIVRM